MSRLNTDVIGAQQAITVTLSSVVGNIISPGSLTVPGTLRPLHQPAIPTRHSHSLPQERQKSSLDQHPGKDSHVPGKIKSPVIANPNHQSPVRVTH
ncbi:MAG TPA: hypothetical protein VF933_12830 [Streptosporangiaceae bacterium]